MTTPTPLSAAQLLLLVPGLSAEAIKADPAAALRNPRAQRSAVFNDETLLFYVGVRVPTGMSEAAARDTFDLLDLSVDTSILNASPSSSSKQPEPTVRSSSSSPPSARLSGTNSSSHPRQASMPSKLQRGGWSIGGGMSIAMPSRGSRTDLEGGGAAGQPGSSFVYDRSDPDAAPIVFKDEDCWCCLFPLSAPVGNVNPTRRQVPTLLISVTVTQFPTSRRSTGDQDDENEWCDPDKLDSVNLLGGLADGLSATGGFCAVNTCGGGMPVYKMLSTTPQNVPYQGSQVVPAVAVTSTAPSRRFVRKSLPVYSALAVGARISPMSPGNDILSISLAINQSLSDELEFTLRHVGVDVSNAVVSACAPLDAGEEEVLARIKRMDEMSMLYNVTLMDDQITGLRGDEQDVTAGVPVPPSGFGSENSFATSFSPSWLFTENSRSLVTVRITGEISGPDLAAGELRSSWYFRFRTPMDVAAAGGQTATHAFRGSRVLELVSGDLSQWAARLGHSEQGATFASARSSRARPGSDSRQHDKKAAKDRRGSAGFKSIIGKLSRQKNASEEATPPSTTTSSPSGSSISSLASRRRSRLFDGGSRKANRPPIRTSMHSVYEARPADKQTGTQETLIVSFSVASEMTVRQIFTLRVFIVNRTNHTRRLTIMIPNRRKLPVPPIPAAVAAAAGTAQQLRHGNLLSPDLPPLPADKKLDLCMENAVFLKRHLENEKNEASVVCLENNVRLTPLQPYSCQSTSMHFIPIKEHLHRIDLIQLLDNDTGTVVSMRDVLEVYVKGADE